MSAVVLLKLILRNKKRKSINYFSKINKENTLRFQLNKNKRSPLCAGSISKICRFCLKRTEDGLYSLFGKFDIDGCLLDSVRSFANVIIEANDGLPQNICSNCVDLIRVINAFKISCYNADKELRNFLCRHFEAFENESNDASSLNELIKLPSLTRETRLKPTEKADNENSVAFLDAGNASDTFQEELNVNTKVALRQLEHLQCEKCHIKFTDESTFTQHCLSKDHLLKRWSCVDCNKDFKRKSDHDVHRRVHTHEKPYICELCGRRFSYNCSFRNHMLVHKKLFPFKCKTCPHMARNTWAIKMHERIHTGERPHRCPHCPATFTTTSNRKRHLLKHLGERPFKCDQCGKTFASKQYLLDHKATVHDNIKQYECSECGLSMGFKRSLRKHELRVHKATRKALGRKPVMDI